MKLTMKEARFIELYTNPVNKDTFGNGTESVKQAGYSHKNDACAGVMSCRLLKKGRIMDAINEVEVKREFDLQEEFDEHTKTISDILKQIKVKGRYTREDLQAFGRLGEVAGKIGGGNRTNILIQNGQQCDKCGMTRITYSDDFQERTNAARLRMIERNKLVDVQTNDRLLSTDIQAGKE